MKSHKPYDEEDRDVGNPHMLLRHAPRLRGEQRGVLRAASKAERGIIEAIWGASQDADDPHFRPRDGWWSLMSWATRVQLLIDEGRPVGVAALHFAPGDEVAEARLALLLSHRRPLFTSQLLDAVVSLARSSHAPRLRAYIPAKAAWAIAAVRQHAFTLLRTQHVMLRPAYLSPFIPCSTS